MLTLNQRVCMIGGSVNTRCELHGEESIPALDIPLSAIMLNASELNALLGEPLAHEALFNRRADHLTEPLFKQLKPFALKDKYEDATVTLTVGLHQTPIVLKNVKLSKLKLEPQVGGLTALSLTVQCTPELDERITTLLAFMNHDAQAEIVTGKRATKADQQPELPLGAHGGEDDDPGDDDVGEEGDDEAEPPAKPAKKTRAAKPKKNPVGTPEQERDLAHQREREIAAKLSKGRGADRVN